MNPLIMNLAKLTLFEDMTLGELEEIFRSFSGGLFSCNPGEIIKFRGEEYDELLILLTGEVETQMQNDEGKVVVVESIKAPSVLAAAFLFSSENIFPVNVIARRKSRLFTIPKKKVIELCQKNEKFLLNLLKDMGNKISLLAEKVYLFSLSDLKERIARYLLSISEGAKNRFKLPVTKEELSKILGVTRPSLSRTFSQLIKEGIIDQSENEIIIKDLEKLKELVKD